MDDLYICFSHLTAPSTLSPLLLLLHRIVHQLGGDHTWFCSRFLPLAPLSLYSLFTVFILASGIANVSIGKERVVVRETGASSLRTPSWLSSISAPTPTQLLPAPSSLLLTFVQQKKKKKSICHLKKKKKKDGGLDVTSAEQNLRRLLRSCFSLGRMKPSLNQF